MGNKLFNHACSTCHKTYLAYDEKRIFCCDQCERYFKRYQKPYGYKGRVQESIHREPVDEAARWLNKKTPVRKRRDLKDIMYRDTFKKYIPKNLRVMRG